MQYRTTCLTQQNTENLVVETYDFHMQLCFTSTDSSRKQHTAGKCKSLELTVCAPTTTHSSEPLIQLKTILLYHPIISGIINAILLDAIYSSYAGRHAELHKFLITTAWHSSWRGWSPDMEGSRNTLNKVSHGMATVGHPTCWRLDIGITIHLHETLCYEMLSLIFNIEE